MHNTAAEDSTTAILCTDESILALYNTKPWRFYWANEAEMAMVEEIRDLNRRYVTGQIGQKDLAERSSALRRGFQENRD